MDSFGLRIGFLLVMLEPAAMSFPPPHQAAAAPSANQAVTSKGGPIKAAKSVATAEERKAFIRAMVKRGNPAIATIIARFIQDADPRVATTACWALGELRNRETSPEAALALQQNPTVLVRATCATALGRIGDPQNTIALSAAASNEKEETDVRLASIQALAMFDTEQGSSLIPLLESRDPRIRASAAYSACQLQIPAATEAIKSMLRSPDEATKRYALEAAGVWPERFSDDLVRIAADPRESPQNRVLSLASMAAFSREQKNADFLKSVSKLVRPEQPPEVQVAAAQVLSDIPAARPLLEKVAQDRRGAPELRERLSEIGLETAAPVQAPEPNYRPEFEGFIGALIGAAVVLLTIYVRGKFGESRSDRIRKTILLEMLRDQRFEGHWRTLDSLVQVIGADQETTTRLLIEIGARASEEKGSRLWGLREEHPFGKEKDP